MLTLNDGRAELWQWDTGRTLAVDADCSQVHFSNKVFGRSIDVDVADGVAIIPDILLQTDKDLNVWAFVGTSESGYTKISKTFKVNRRNKPADYVFTQTDQMTLQTIQRQIGDLADLTTEAKDTLVAAINEAARTGGGAGIMDLRVADGYVQYSTDGGMTWTNLIAMSDLKGADGITPTIGSNGNWYLGDTDTGKPSRGETGPAGADGKDGATGAAGADGHTPVKGTDYFTEADKQEIAAAAAGMVSIPDKLPNPNALTFTGAVSGSYDGSEAKTINIPSGGGSEGQWQLVTKYVHSGNLEVAIDSIDYDTSTITATAHGLSDGDMIYATLNVGIIAAPLPYMPTGISYATKYYVINAAENTFQISASEGGTAASITEKSTADFSKWHFERDTDKYGGSILLTGLTLLNDLKVVGHGKSLSYKYSGQCVPSADGEAMKERAASRCYADGFYARLSAFAAIATGTIMAASKAVIAKKDYGYEGKVEILNSVEKANSTYGITSTGIDDYTFLRTDKLGLGTILKYWNFYPANGYCVEVYTR